MTDFQDRDERLAIARAEYEHVMTTPSPDPSGAYLEAGVVGYVFGEMWRRGVLTPRDRRFVTMSCVGAVGAVIPIETHTWAALNSDDLTYAEFDEFVLHFATQLGWPKASALQMYGMTSVFRLAEERGLTLEAHDHEPWADPTDDDTRRRRGEDAYREMMGAEPPPARSPFRGRASLDYVFGEVWTRERHLTRRDRRIVSICCAASVGIDEETVGHLRAALQLEDLTLEELQEVVMHVTVYLGWVLGRRLDDLLLGVAEELGLS